MRVVHTLAMSAHRIASPTLFALLGASLACQRPTSPPPETPSPPAVAEGEPARERAVEEEPGVVRFFARRIDLRPFLAGFPYRSFTNQLEDGKLFYLDTRERYTLLALDVTKDTEALALEHGEKVTDVDFSQRSLWNVHYVPARNELWLHADERNDERMNLYRVDLASEQRTPVAETDEDYIYAFGFSEDDRYLAWLPRTGKSAPFTTCLHVRDFAAPNQGKDSVRKVVCDTPELRFTWGEMVFSPDGKELFFSAQVADDRNRVQIVRVDLTKRKPVVTPITDTTRTRSTADLILGESKGDKFYFLANDDGYTNVYAYSRKTKQVTQLTHYREDIDDAVLAAEGVFLSHGTPKGSTLELVDLENGKAKASVRVPGKVNVLDAHGGTAFWTHRAPDVMFELNATRFVTNEQGALTFTQKKLAGPAEPLQNAVVQCQAEAVEVPTFDVDPHTGEKRKLHAFLLTPKQPPSEADHMPGKLALIRSFYGGDNVYTQYDHILCAAGITILSPSVRGSDGFGKEFHALNDGDLGGDEIVDLFYAARWLEARTGLKPAHIGVYGRSHGGYATMRALTFPPETNGRNESYPFGFGIAEAGFSDIEAFYRATNIPDWVVLEAGDPETPEGLAKVRDRSPLSHVARLSAPLFLLHGENDWRVPVAGSRAFAEAARALNKPVTYVEVKGQGHSIEGIERIAQTWDARFDFLERVLRGQ